ncbi:MAG: fatty acid desaturase [Minicystis sp.]
MRPRVSDLALHLARLALSAGVLALSSRYASLPGMIAGGTLFFLEAFAFQHDLAHGALGLPRRVNEGALAVVGALMFMSGHAIRRTHLVHHARPLSDDDFEGRPARETFLRALAGGACGVLAHRVRAFRGAGPRGQRWQIVENLAGAALLAAIVASGEAALLVYAAVAILAQLTMGLWASHIPHNAPGWLVRVAERLAWTGSPTVLSLAYHELHHARPQVPCRRLGAAARAAA